MTAGTRVAIYARVSTKNGNGNGQKQTCDTQLESLREHCRQRGWVIAEEFTDTGVSGSKSSRPALDRMMAEAAMEPKKFDAVLVWKLDRFGRSVNHLSNAIKTLDSLGVAFVSLTDNLDMTTPQGRLMFNMLSSFAEFERELIRERVTAGIKRAQNAAARENRVRGAGRHRTEIDWDAVRNRIAFGESRRAIAQSMNISPSLISKWLKGDAPR